MAKLLRQKAIKTSTSDYTTNPFFIGKKSSSHKRPVIDYRGVNVKVKVPQFPLPRINRIIQEVKFSWSVQHHWSHKRLLSNPITSQISENDSFQKWWSLLWILCSSFQNLLYSSLFLDFLSGIFVGMEEHVSVYLDDIIIHSSAEDHLKIIEEIFNRLEEANLVVNGSQNVLLGEERLNILVIRLNM